MKDDRDNRWMRQAGAKLHTDLPIAYAHNISMYSLYCDNFIPRSEYSYLMSYAV